MGEERTPQGLRGRDLAGLGGILVAGVVGGLVIGLLVDNAAGSSPLWTLVGITVGIVARRRRLRASASATPCVSEVSPMTQQPRTPHFDTGRTTAPVAEGEKVGFLRVLRDQRKVIWVARRPRRRRLLDPGAAR